MTDLSMYPMRTPSEAQYSIQRVNEDYSAGRIDYNTFAAVKEAIARRFNQAKKQALLAGVAHIVRRSSPQEKGPPRRAARD